MTEKSAHRFFPWAVAFTVWALVAVWIRHETVKTSFQVSKKRQELAQIREENVRLYSRLEQLRSPARLERLAKEQFRLGPPNKNQIIIIPDIADEPIVP